MKKIKKLNEKGFVLITSFMIISVLIILSAAIIAQTISEKNAAQRYCESMQALFVSEAGIQRAIHQLNDSGNWTGWSDELADGEGQPYREITEILGTVGSYYVKIVNPLSNTPMIISRGHVPDTVISRVKRDLTVEVGKETPFNYAGFGKTSITMTGSGSTDSYNSKDPYDPLEPGVNGDIGTNADEATVTGEATVNGDIETNADITLTVVIAPDSLTVLGTFGDESLNSGEILILSENRKYNSLTVNPGGKVIIDGDRELYFTGAMTLKGDFIIQPGSSLIIYTDAKCSIGGTGIVNQTEIPENLIIYSTYSGTGDAVSFTGAGAYYGAVYAPEGDVLVSGSGDVYGSLIGDNVTVSGGGNIHYDEALQDIGIGGYEIRLWQDGQQLFTL